jgi:hypothetical protein
MSSKLYGSSFFFFNKKIYKCQNGRQMSSYNPRSRASSEKGVRHGKVIKSTSSSPDRIKTGNNRANYHDEVILRHELAKLRDISAKS